MLCPCAVARAPRCRCCRLGRAEAWQRCWLVWLATAALGARAGTPVAAAGWLADPLTQRLTPVALLLSLPRTQCKGVLPAEEMPDGTKPTQRWNQYQLWWQTIMTTAAPELRAMGWNNLKCARLGAACLAGWLGGVLALCSRGCGGCGAAGGASFAARAAVRPASPCPWPQRGRLAFPCAGSSLTLSFPPSAHLPSRPPRSSRHPLSIGTAPLRRILSDAKSANERRMASCADLLITSTTMFWQLYPFK